MSGLEPIRREAARRFSELGFPTTRNEEWRFTNVAPIAKTSFARAPAMGNVTDEAQLEERIAYTNGSPRLVFVNGHYSPELSSRNLPRSVRAVSFKEANGTVAARGSNRSLTVAALKRTLAAHLARYASYQVHPFVALNTANFEDGAYLEIQKGTVVEEPIHLVFLTAGSGEPIVSHPRCLIVAGPDSQVTIVETYAGKGERYLSNGVTEVVAEDHSVVDHYKVQMEDEQSFHIGMLQAQIGRDASLATHSIALGGGLVRNDVNAVLAEGTSAIVNGLYLASGAQHVDNHTSIDHAQPHGTSHELYKGVLGGRSAAVFNGKIIVRPGAQKTDAKQTNKNLLLSEEATINTKPQLQIHANDVRCTHGATIGQLDREAIYYLQTRGIGQEDARALLTLAFARDILDRIKVEPLRGFLERKLVEKLHEQPRLPFAALSGSGSLSDRSER
jgi:Fe-S cluster assembly protein SufD